MAHEEKSSTLAMWAVISQLSIFIADCAHVTCDVSMRTMTNEIWLSAAINASLHVNIFPGQGDTKASTNLVGPRCSHDNQPYVSPIRLQLALIWVAMVTISTMCDLFCKL